MDSHSEFGNFTDPNRYVNCLFYLHRLDKSSDLSKYPKGYKHSVYMNSYIELSISRSSPKFIHILVTRRSDNCYLFVKKINKLYKEAISDVAQEIVEYLISNEHKITKCKLCREASVTGKEYCKMCCLLESTYTDNICPICIDDNKKTTVWRKLPCHHLFHNSCVSKMVDNEQVICPMCRKVTMWEDSFIY